MTKQRTTLAALAIVAILPLAACLGKSEGSGTVGGTVSGLATGASLVLIENNASTLTITANGTFELPEAVPARSAYNVAIVTQPAGQQCTLGDASGTIDATADAVTNITVTCLSATTIGGSVSGLSSGNSVTLTDGIVSLPVGANGAFTFSDGYVASAIYNVTVASQPLGQACTVANGSGSIDANGDAVANITVACVVDAQVSGTVQGLAAGATVIISDSLTQLPVQANGSFTFNDIYAPGAAYAVFVSTPPSGQSCNVTNGSGVIDANGDAVSNIVVSCATGGTVGGTVSGLAIGASVTLSDGTKSLAISTNGSFAFSDFYVANAPYAVTVTGQPATQTCTVTNGSGNFDIHDSAVTGVVVTCQ